MEPYFICCMKFILSLRRAVSPSFCCSADLLQTFAAQLRLSHGYAESICLPQFSKTLVYIHFSLATGCSTSPASPPASPPASLPLSPVLTPSNICRSTPIRSWVCSSDLPRRVHYGGGSTLVYVHDWRLTGCSSSPSSLLSPAPPSLVLTPSNLCRSTPIDSCICSIDLSRPVHPDNGSMLGYVHDWCLTGCSTSHPSPPPSVLTPFELLQINSDWLMDMLNRFVSPSTSTRCKHAEVCPLSTLDWLLYISSFSYSTSTDPVPTFADRLGLTRGYAQSIRLAEYIKTVQERWGMSMIDAQLAT